MQSYGVTRLYAKLLAPNDNSKNQIYLGGDFSALNVIPHGPVEIDTRVLAGSKHDRPKARLNFYWVDHSGRYVAPNAQLVLYPDYPEVRLSGLLKQCVSPPSDVIAVRDEGRVLVFGITTEGDIMAFAAGAGTPVARQVRGGLWPCTGVFLVLPITTEASQANAKELLLSELRRIHYLNWIPSQKLNRDGQKMPYVARNGGGYTLEAELGVTPNGFSEPDFMGWEVKQFGVNNFIGNLPKSPVTLMTPEPSGGVYSEKGVAEFLRRFGYADKAGKKDRINFGGVYAQGKPLHPETGLKLQVDGFNNANATITDLGGKISLCTEEGEIAAAWPFVGLLSHWNRKHAKAAYVPSISDVSPPRYAYGNRVKICEGTDFILFLKAVADGVVFYDPAIKAENVSSAEPKTKKRSQFRIQHRELGKLYHQSELVMIA